MFVRVRQYLFGHTPRRFFSHNPFQEEFNLKLKENLKIIRLYRKFTKYSRSRGYPLRKLLACAMLVVLGMLTIPGNKMAMQS